MTSTAPEFPAPKIVGFLEALDLRLELQDGLLWGNRQVAGEAVAVAFHYATALDSTGLRAATTTLSKAGRSAPEAALYLIAERPLPEGEVERFSDIGVTATTQVGYLNLALQSRRVSADVIKGAQKYIPEHEYVGQTFAPDGVSATDTLRKWNSDGDAGLLVVLAAGGYGKTCLANQLARELANRHLGDSASQVPFLLPLHRHRHVRRFEELVLTHLQDSGIHGFTSSAFAYLVNEHRVVLILDGFDELAETGGIRVARETLRGLMSQLSPNAKVLLTSRQAYFRHRGDLSLLGADGVLEKLQIRELQPFDSERRALFLERRGLEKKQIRAIQDWVDRTQSEDVLGSPLILKILADETKQGGNIPASTAGEVLDFSLGRVCEREIGKGAFAWDSGKQLAFLSQIADLMFEGNAYDLEAEWLREIVDEDAPRDLPPARRKEEILARVTQLKNHPLLVGHVVDGQDVVGFPHPLYRDFLIARNFRQQFQAGQSFERSLRLGLPEATTALLADLMKEDDIAQLLQTCIDRRTEPRSVWSIILERCELASKSDLKTRTKTLLQSVSTIRDFGYQNLSRLRFQLLKFEGFSFVGATFAGSAFQSCQFVDCDFTGAQLGGTRFYECSADPETANQLGALGIALGPLEKKILRADVVPVTNEDPVTALVQKFFRRFIRDERGRHQRTAKVESMVAGLGGEERKFTEREIIPEMRKHGIIEEKHAGVDVYLFNADWQADGDAVIWDSAPTERLRAIIETLRSKARRYGLL